MYMHSRDFLQLTSPRDWDSFRPDGIIRTQSSEVCQRVYTLIDRIARTNNFLIKLSPCKLRSVIAPPTRVSRLKSVKSVSPGHQLLIT